MSSYDGHEYITVRLRNRCVPETPPETRALMNEAATVIEGRDRALHDSSAFKILRRLVSHWDEFGHEHGMDEKMDDARRFVRSVTG